MTTGKEELIQSVLKMSLVGQIIKERSVMMMVVKPRDAAGVDHGPGVGIG